MGILGIKNRTENWQTAQKFGPFLECSEARTKLAKRLVGENCVSESDKIEIELFWYGVRDHIFRLKENKEKKCFKLELLKACNCWLPRIRKNLVCLKKQSKIKLKLGDNGNGYRMSDRKDCVALLKNLRNTEIDVVLTTPRHLCVGEVKWESDFGSNGRHVLVHQLIRQFVMANALVEAVGCDRTVVPFVILDNVPTNSHQVRFMTESRYMCCRNVLSWKCIENLACPIA